jgi:hypothetical protein
MQGMAGMSAFQAPYCPFTAVFPSIPNQSKASFAIEARHNQQLLGQFYG